MCDLSFVPPGATVAGRTTVVNMTMRSRRMLMMMSMMLIESCEISSRSQGPWKQTKSQRELHPSWPVPVMHLCGSLVASRLDGFEKIVSHSVVPSTWTARSFQFAAYRLDTQPLFVSMTGDGVCLSKTAAALLPAGSTECVLFGWTCLRFSAFVGYLVEMIIGCRRKLILFRLRFSMLTRTSRSVGDEGVAMSQ